MEKNIRFEGEEPRILRLVKVLRDDTATLFRQEVALAKTELQEKAQRVSRNAVYATVGAVTVAGGVGLLLLAVTVALFWGLIRADMVAQTAMWLAPTIVGGVLALIGIIALAKGVSTIKHESLTPQRTIRSLEEDKEWIRRKTN